MSFGFCTVYKNNVQQNKYLISNMIHERTITILKFVLRHGAVLWLYLNLTHNYLYIPKLIVYFKSKEIVYKCLFSFINSFSFGQMTKFYINKAYLFPKHIRHGITYICNKKCTKFTKLKTIKIGTKPAIHVSYPYKFYSTCLSKKKYHNLNVWDFFLTFKKLCLSSESMWLVQADTWIRTSASMHFHFNLNLI